MVKYQKNFLHSQWRKGKEYVLIVDEDSGLGLMCSSHKRFKPKFLYFAFFALVSCILLLFPMLFSLTSTFSLFCKPSFPLFFSLPWFLVLFICFCFVLQMNLIEVSRVSSAPLFPTVSFSYSSQFLLLCFFFFVLEGKVDERSFKKYRYLSPCLLGFFFNWIWTPYLGYYYCSGVGWSPQWKYFAILCLISFFHIC